MIRPSITHRPSQSISGFSMIGLLVTMVCIVVLFAILMNSMNKAITGQGSAQQGTVRSFQDELYLRAIIESMITHAGENKGLYIVPSHLNGRNDVSQNTTASLFSAMLMKQYTIPKQLISGNEYSGYVDECENYDYNVYNPTKGVFWDPEFKADLHKLSHTSFAHMPLHGKRFERQWRSTMASDFPLLGNRGPKDGIDDPTSMTYGRNQRWGGHLAFGDGHIEFIDTFTLGRVFIERDGQRYADNIFAMEDGPAGGDAIISFTKTMSPRGPELQYD